MRYARALSTAVKSTELATWVDGASSSVGGIIDSTALT
jgi:hypothetical protein